MAAAFHVALDDRTDADHNDKTESQIFIHTTRDRRQELPRRKISSLAASPRRWRTSFHSSEPVAPHLARSRLQHSRRWRKLPRSQSQRPKICRARLEPRLYER